MSPRRDAERNRIRLLEAGREVFGRQGFEATLDDVAAAAGLGTGTAYRHFANKHELARELMFDSYAATLADLAVAERTDDPGEALVGFFTAAAARQAGDRGLREVLGGEGKLELKADVWPEISRRTTSLVQRARDARVLRSDVTADDLALGLAMLGPVYDFADRSGRPDLWRRYLAIYLDGLRAGERQPLPVESLGEQAFNALLLPESAGGDHVT